MKRRYGFKETMAGDFAAKNGEVMTPSEVVSDLQSLEQQLAALREENEKLLERQHRMEKELRDAKRVIMLYRRWEHACDAEWNANDECDTGTMLIEASFAAQDFVDEWELKITPAADREGE